MRDRQTDRETQRQRETERERDRERERERERERKTQSDTERDREQIPNVYHTWRRHTVSLSPSRCQTTSNHSNTGARVFPMTFCLHCSWAMSARESAQEVKGGSV